jgi:hypothetical protein
MLEIYSWELSQNNLEPMDDHYFFQCDNGKCGTIEKIHFYTYEAMMDYEEDKELEEELTRLNKEYKQKMYKGV